MLFPPELSGFAFEPRYLSLFDANRLLKYYLAQAYWRQVPITIAGKSVLQPRLQHWMADTNITYSYSGLQLTANPWDDETDKLRAQFASRLGVPLNAALLNLYRDGRDYMGWHSDDERELGAQPTIVSLSLGATRDFVIKNKAHSIETTTFPLEHGSLLVMSGESQRNFLHALPKRRKIQQPRVNITFRQILERF